MEFWFRSHISADQHPMDWSFFDVNFSQVVTCITDQARKTDGQTTTNQKGRNNIIPYN